MTSAGAGKRGRRTDRNLRPWDAPETLAAASRRLAAICGLPVPVSVRVSRRARGGGVAHAPAAGPGGGGAGASTGASAPGRGIQAGLDRGRGGQVAALGELPGMVPVIFSPPRGPDRVRAGIPGGLPGTPGPGRLPDQGHGRRASGRGHGTGRIAGGDRGRAAGPVRLVRDRAGPLLVAALREVGREAGLPFASARGAPAAHPLGELLGLGKNQPQPGPGLSAVDLVRYAFSTNCATPCTMTTRNASGTRCAPWSRGPRALDAALSGAGHYVPLWFSGTVTAPAS
jgi:hypothetical protein